MLPEWRSIRGNGVARRYRVFREEVVGVLGRPGSTASSVDHAWAGPMHMIAAHAPPERRLVARKLLREMNEMYREARRIGGDERALDGRLGEHAAIIRELLESPLAFPRRSDFERERRNRKATNLGLEIELTKIGVEARAGRNGAVVSAQYGFHAKCMLEERPGRYIGFSVQSDGGHLELVSDPPVTGLPPADTAREMARFTLDRQRKLRGPRDDKPGTGPWLPARRAVPDAAGVHHPIEHRGKRLQVRMDAQSGETHGTFHVTVGVHLAAMPWLFASGATAEDQVEAASTHAGTGDPDTFPLPGHVLRRREHRQEVLTRLQRLRAGAQGLALTPAFEGFAYLVFVYLASALSGPQEKVLSPKQNFLVLARSDFASMLRLTSEGGSSRARRTELLNALLAVIDHVPPGQAPPAVNRSDQPMFDALFGSGVPPLDEVMDAAAGIAPKFMTRYQRRQADPANFVPLTVTARQWLDELFADTPVDMLTPDYHRVHRVLDPALFRGMGELGDKVDRIDAGATRPLPAPLLELRRVTPGSEMPLRPHWESFTEKLVDMITALNAPASRAEVRRAIEELERIRVTGVAPRFPPAQMGNAQAARHLEVDHICGTLRVSMGSAYLRAELWTLLDRARNLVQPATRSRDVRQG